MAEEDKTIVAITAAMEAGTGLSEFAATFPERFFDVGIAEPHAISFAASMAHAGLHPFVAIYSTFLTRAIDQVIQDVSISRASIVLLVDRAGLVGADGETHHGYFDVGYLMMIPHMEVWIPFSKEDFEATLDYAKEHKGPIAIRYPRDLAHELEEQLPSSFQKCSFCQNLFWDSTIVCCHRPFCVFSKGSCS